MKKIRNILSLALVFVFSLSMVACSTEKEVIEFELDVPVKVMSVGETQTASLILPDNFDTEDMEEKPVAKWETSDSEILTVSEFGVINALSIGTAEVKLTYSETTKTVTVEVVEAVVIQDTEEEKVETVPDENAVEGSENVVDKNDTSKELGNETDKTETPVKPEDETKPVSTPEPTPKPTATPKPTEKPVATPKPTEAPKPEATPKPTEKPVETPKPTEKPVPTPEPHVHSWSGATCTEPQKCSCGATNGGALGHAWQGATYTAPKTCGRCGATEGSPLPQPTPDASGTIWGESVILSQVDNGLSQTVGRDI